VFQDPLQIHLKIQLLKEQPDLIIKASAVHREELNQKNSENNQ
jgi:hypothetical protein